MVILPTSEAPFGIFNPLHSYILNNASPITTTNWPKVLILPTLPVAIQCYLLQYPNTKSYRIGIGALGVTALLQTWGNHRFTGMFNLSSLAKIS